MDPMRLKGLGLAFYNLFIYLFIYLFAFSRNAQNKGTQAIRLSWPVKCGPDLNQGRVKWHLVVCNCVVQQNQSIRDGRTQKK